MSIGGEEKSIFMLHEGRCRFGCGRFPQGGGFCLLRTISNFTYEMVKIPGRHCHGWQCQEMQGMDALHFRPDRFGIICPFH